MGTYTLTEATLQFDLGDKIGGGGEGEVFKAIDKQLQSEIAVKKIPIVSTVKFDKYFEEAKKLYLSTHHNVVDVNYACWDARHVYLAMPYYKNGSISGLLSKRFLTVREIIRFALHFLSGLNNIHSKGLIHFDIKPENILISDAGHALVSDFGLAQYFDRFGFAANLGTTPVLAPPELFVIPEHTLRFDIYQAGMALYVMCNGYPNLMKQANDAAIKRGVVHFDHFVERLKRGDYPIRSEYLPHIPRQLRKVISNALAVDPNDRYASVIDMLNDLSEINTANDWEYSIDSSGNEQWVWDNRKVNVSLNGVVWHVIAEKAGRKSSEFTKKISNLVDKNDLLYKCLNTKW